LILMMMTTRMFYEKVLNDEHIAKLFPLKPLITNTRPHLVLLAVSQVVSMMVPPELAAVLEEGDLSGLQKGAENYLALVARPEVAAKVKKAMQSKAKAKAARATSPAAAAAAAAADNGANSTSAFGGGGGGGVGGSHKRQDVLLSFLEQPFNDSGVMPRLSFVAAAKGHVEMLRWMIQQVGAFGYLVCQHG
jgi:hypothetical protein